MLYVISILGMVIVLWMALKGKKQSAVVGVTDSEIRNFFSESRNYVERPIEEIFSVLGRPRDYDDWDWGRLVYEWGQGSVRIRVVVRGGCIICVQELDPQDQSRYGTILKLLWGDAGP